MERLRQFTRVFTFPRSVLLAFLAGIALWAAVREDLGSDLDERSPDAPLKKAPVLAEPAWKAMSIATTVCCTGTTLAALCNARREPLLQRLLSGLAGLLAGLWFGGAVLNMFGQRTNV